MTVATLKIPDDAVTVAAVAERFGKDESHIRRLCIDMNLGKVVFGRIRLLGKGDVDRLKKHFEAVGRNRPKKVS
jgi:hypothetical protein